MAQVTRGGGSSTEQSLVSSTNMIPVPGEPTASTGLCGHGTHVLYTCAAHMRSYMQVKHPCP